MILNFFRHFGGARHLLEGVEAEDRVLRYIRTSYENWKTPVKAKWAQGRPTCCKLFLLQLCNRSHPKAQSDSLSLSLSLSLLICQDGWGAWFGEWIVNSGKRTHWRLSLRLLLIPLLPLSTFVLFTGKRFSQLSLSLSLSLSVSGVARAHMHV
jgi:hypothetical protein